MSGKSSIRRRLLVGLIMAIALTWAVVVVYVMRGAGHEVEEIFDASLAQEARVLAALLGHEAEEEREARNKVERVLAELGSGVLERSPTLAEVARKTLSDPEDRDYLTLLNIDDVPGHKYESKIAFLVRYDDDKVMLSSPNAPSFRDFVKGFETRTISGSLWRIFGLEDNDRGLKVQVAERVEVRRETIDYILKNNLWPILVALPVFAFIIWVTVSQGMRPLNRVADNVEQRAPGSLHPIATDSVPAEVVPMVESLNRLFGRVSRTLDNERRFTANASHELRTPLAALKTYVQAKQLSHDGRQHEDFFAEIVIAVDRTTHLLEQLLTLARADSQAYGGTPEDKVDLHDSSVNLMSGLGNQALKKHIEMSLDADDPEIFVRGDKTALEILFRNLLDNAIRYTPEGGNVEVTVRADPNTVYWQVSDDGPGIQKDQQELLFERFQRGEAVAAQGSGLGLSIVKQIAELHNADVRLGQGLSGTGLSVTVVFPREHG